MSISIIVPLFLYILLKVPEPKCVSLVMVSLVKVSLVKDSLVKVSLVKVSLVKVRSSLLFIRNICYIDK